MSRTFILFFMLVFAGGIKYAQADDIQNYIKLQLSQDAINRDETVIFFRDKTSTAFERANDIGYFAGNGQVSLASLSSDNKSLTLNMQPFPKAATVIALNVSTKSSGIFKLIMKEMMEVPPLFDIWLIDKMRNDSLDMRHNDTYTFNVSKTDTNSFGSKRFKLIVRQNPGHAYRLLGFWAKQESDYLRLSGVRGVKLNWKVENEQAYTKFAVERSVDNGKTFVILDSLVASKLGEYSFMDKDPVMGNNIYRLKQDDITHNVTFSKPVQVNYSRQQEGSLFAFAQKTANIYPNPAIDIVNVSLKSERAERYDISVTNMSGSVVRQVTTAQVNWQFQVADLLPGIYIVKVLNSSDKSLVTYDRFSKR